MSANAEQNKCVKGKHSYPSSKGTVPLVGWFILPFDNAWLVTDMFLSIGQK